MIQRLLAELLAETDERTRKLRRRFAVDSDPAAAAAYKASLLRTPQVAAKTGRIGKLTTQFRQTMLRQIEVAAFRYRRSSQLSLDDVMSMFDQIERGEFDEKQLRHVAKRAQALVSDASRQARSLPPPQAPNWDAIDVRSNQALSIVDKIVELGREVISATDVTERR